MARTTRMKVAGLDDLKKKLDGMPDDVRTAAAEAVDESAEAAKDEMRDSVRVDTGQLRDSIGADVDRAELSAEVGTQGSDAYYAPFIEFGTSSQAPQPFAVPAAERQRKEFPKRLRQQVSRNLPTE